MSEIYHCSTHEKMCVLHELLSWCASFSCGVNADENHRSVSFIGKYLPGCWKTLAFRVSRYNKGKLWLDC